MFNSLTLLLAIAGLAMLSAGGIAYSLLYGRIQAEDKAGRRLDQIQSRGAVVAETRGRVDPAKRRKSVEETLKELDKNERARAKRSKSPPLALRIEQAGLKWSRRTFMLISLGCSLFAVLIAYLVGAPLYAVFAAALVGLFGLPRWFVNFLRKRRMKKFLNEFANAVDVIVRGIKAGLPLNDCIRIIASEAQEPVASEFRLIAETQAMGISMAEAVGKLPQRIPVPEANFFAIVISVQAKAGGNLSEALGNLSRVLRDRKKMKGKIQAMSMEAKASGGIIGALPLVVMGIVFLTSPAYIALLFTDHTGNIILGVSACWMATGVFIMRRMINFDF
jgi:tight adherence protein B